MGIFDWLFGKQTLSQKEIERIRNGIKKEMPSDPEEEVKKPKKEKKVEITNESIVELKKQLDESIENEFKLYVDKTATETSKITATLKVEELAKKIGHKPKKPLINDDEVKYLEGVYYCLGKKYDYEEIQEHNHYNDEELDLDNTYDMSLIRFFKNQKVLLTTMMGNLEDIPSMSSLLDLDKNEKTNIATYLPVNQYFIEGKKISFKDEDEEGVVEYNGEILNTESISLNIYSHINNYKEDGCLYKKYNEGGP